MRSEGKGDLVAAEVVVSLNRSETYIREQLHGRYKVKRKKCHTLAPFYYRAWRVLFILLLIPCMVVPGLLLTLRLRPPRGLGPSALAGFSVQILYTEQVNMSHDRVI